LIKVGKRNDILCGGRRGGQRGMGGVVLIWNER